MSYRWVAFLPIYLGFNPVLRAEEPLLMPETGDPIHITVRKPFEELERPKITSLDQYVLRSLDEITGICSGWSIRYFRQLFAHGVPMSDLEVTPEGAESETEGPALAPVSLEILQETSQVIKGLIEKDAIKTEQTFDPGTSASWGESIEDDRFVGGTMEINPNHLERAVDHDNPRNRDVDLLRSQEILANSILHEAVHIFFSYFRDALNAEPTFEPQKLTTAFASGSFWDGSGVEDHGLRITNGDGVYLTYNLSKNQAYSVSNMGNEETARQIAQHIIVCTNGAAVGRILNLPEVRKRDSP